MEKIAILIGALFAVSFVNAQKNSDNAVPAVVKSAMQKAYPNAEELEWEKENNNYEADFEIDDTDYSLLIDVSGNILETEIEIPVSELPAGAKDYVSKNYAGKKIKEAAKISDNKGVVTYEAEVNGKDLIFDNNGNFIKVEEETEMKDDKD